ncbi:MAG: helix-turn-helix domain-containing protein [Dehalococcoidia bacterium]
MRRGRPLGFNVCLTHEERALLRQQSRQYTLPVGEWRRTMAILYLDMKLSEKETAERCGLGVRIVRSGRDATWSSASRPSRMPPGAAASRSFPPEVAVEIVKIACELPAERDAPLSQWDCTEIARQLQDDGIVKQISRETVRRVLARHSLRPWRVQAWLSPKVPRDQQYRQQVADILALYTGLLAADERVLCVDEKTSLRPAADGADASRSPGRPVRMEHEYGRRGALNLFAAFDTRCGQVLARTASRARVRVRRLPRIPRCQP